NPRNQQPNTIAPDKDDAKLELEVRPGTPAGTYTLMVRGEAQPTANRPNNNIRPRVHSSYVQASEPITLTVLPPQVAKLDVKPTANNPKAGQETEVLIKVTRLGDFKGKMTLQLVAPAKVKGISAEEVTLPAGKDEAKLMLKAAPDVPPVRLNDLILKATATLRDGT